MKRVAVRELKAKLSEYLSRVKAGEEVVVTERGRPIARLVPITASDSYDQRLMEMERQGLVVLGSGELEKEFWELPRIQDPEGRALGVLSTEREEGR